MIYTFSKFKNLKFKTNFFINCYPNIKMGNQVSTSKYQSESFATPRALGSLGAGHWR